MHFIKVYFGPQFNLGAGPDSSNGDKQNVEIRSNILQCNDIMDQSFIELFLEKSSFHCRITRLKNQQSMEQSGTEPMIIIPGSKCSRTSCMGLR